MKRLRLAVLGAGNRGNAYGDYLLRYPYEGQIVAVAEPAEQRRAAFAAKHRIAPTNQFADWRDLLRARPQIDGLIITLQDRLHIEPTLCALEAGYHVLLEKPISPDPAECLAVAAASERHNKTVTVCHVLRYTPFFETVKRIVEEGRIGDLISLQWTEQVGYWHMAHSYVRGNWRDSTTASPMILAKSCHDLDLIAWLVGQPCEQVSSFGSLSHFRPEHAPAGAPERCTDGCPAAAQCPYNALEIYLRPGEGWPFHVLTQDLSPAGRLHALQTGPYGRCVYRCDNNVVDHQVVNLAFAGGITASFSMVGFTNEINRTFQLFGTHGELTGDLKANELTLRTFGGATERIQPAVVPGGHHGGDYGLMRAWLQHLRAGELPPSTARQSAETHLLAFAAEASRLSGATLDFRAWSHNWLA